MQASPESTPALKDYDPNGPIWSLGLLGAKASSSIGLKTASGFLFYPLMRYVPLVPSSVSFGLRPLLKPNSIWLMAVCNWSGHFIYPKMSMKFPEETSWSFVDLSVEQSEFSYSVFCIFWRFNLVSFSTFGASLSITIFSEASEVPIREINLLFIWNRKRYI